MLRAHLVVATCWGALLACTPAPRPTPAVPPPVSVTGASAPAPQLDDAAIATIAVTLANGQAERARMALHRAYDGRVKRFADRLLADESGDAIALMNLAPRTSILEDELTSETNSALDELGIRTNVDFDRAFVQFERSSLARDLLLFDSSLIPESDNVQLRNSLKQMRATLADELREADYVASLLPPGH